LKTGRPPYRSAENPSPKPPGPANKSMMGIGIKRKIASADDSGNQREEY